MEHEETKVRSFIAEEEYSRLLALSNTIIGAAIEVHKELGPGLLINFNVPKLREGIKRKLNGYVEYKGIKPIRA